MPRAAAPLRRLFRTGAPIPRRHVLRVAVQQLRVGISHQDQMRAPAVTVRGRLRSVPVPGPTGCSAARRWRHLPFPGRTGASRATAAALVLASCSCSCSCSCTLLAAFVAGVCTIVMLACCVVVGVFLPWGVGATSLLQALWLSRRRRAARGAAPSTLRACPQAVCAAHTALAPRLLVPPRTLPRALHRGRASSACTHRTTLGLIVRMRAEGQRVPGCVAAAPSCSHRAR